MGFVFALVMLAAIPMLALSAYKYVESREKKHLFSFAVGVLFIASYWYMSEVYTPKVMTDIKESADRARDKRETIVLTKPAGKLVNATFQHSSFLLIFNQSYTTIETTDGFYKVQGSHNGQKGVAMKLELRANGQEYLCYEGNGECMLTISR